LESGCPDGIWIRIRTDWVSTLRLSFQERRVMEGRVMVESCRSIRLGNGRNESSFPFLDPEAG
ncbi:MAG: hypothetical protein KC944_11900, partial [Candidatus Omnitrophica bacterium]|nr:hypothetical protein [Candidatus Omnitrophota bacterium]